MSDWESTLPHTWLLRGLPGPETDGVFYTFYIGHLDYIVPEGKQAIYLTIPEIPNRDAESPKYPEQEAWVNKVLAEQQIQARDIWWSHWQFTSLDDAITFEKLLWKFGAMRLWTLTQISKEPGVLVERFIFKIIPSETGTLCLLIETEPQMPALHKRLAALVRRVLSKHHIKARKKRNQDLWEFDTMEEAQRFEETLWKMMKRYRGRSFVYAGQL